MTVVVGPVGGPHPSRAADRHERVGPASARIHRWSRVASSAWWLRRRFWLTMPSIAALIGAPDSTSTSPENRRRPSRSTIEVPLGTGLLVPRLDTVGVEVPFGRHQPRQFVGAQPGREGDELALRLVEDGRCGARGATRSSSETMAGRRGHRERAELRPLPTCGCFAGSRRSATCAVPWPRRPVRSSTASPIDDPVVAWDERNRRAEALLLGERVFAELDAGTARCAGC